MKMNPDSVAAIAAIAIGQRPMPRPAAKKSVTVCVRRAAQTAMAAQTAK